MNQPKMSGGAGLAIEHLPVLAPVDSLNLEGILSVPTAARGVVLFAHGSGSSRHSPRNRYVADILNESGLATLLIDLLTEDEQEVDLQTAHLRFDIPLLARRLEGITEWLVEHPEVQAWRWAISGPARERRRRWWLQRSCLRWCAPWFRAAEGPILPDLPWRRWKRPRF